MRLTLFLFVLAISFESYAQAPQLPRENQYEFAAEVSHFTTENNFGTYDGTSKVPHVGSFTNTKTKLQVSYNLSSDWRVFGSGSFAHSASDDGNLSRSNSGLSEFDLGGQFWKKLGPSIALGPEAVFTYPAFRVDEDSDDTLIGEGAMRLRTGGWVLFQTGMLRPYLYAGFEYRDGGRAYLLPYRVGITLKPNQFWAQLEFRGHETVVDDANSEDRDIRGLYLRTVNGGSLHFYSINPSLRELATEVGVSFGDFNLKGGFAITVDGHNAADGWTGLVAVSYSPQPKYEEPPQDDRRFEFKNEKYDESLFQDEVSVERNGKPKPKIRKKLRKKPMVDQLLQETQKELEEK